MKLFNEQLQLCEGKVKIELYKPPVKITTDPQLSGLKSEERTYLEVHIFSKDHEPPVEVNTFILDL